MKSFKEYWYLWGIIVLLVLGIVLFNCIPPITEDNNVSMILAFVGILATFVVVSNYAQVKEIESNFRKSISKIEKERDEELKKLIDKIFNGNSEIIQIATKSLYFYLNLQICDTFLRETTYKPNTAIQFLLNSTKYLKNKGDFDNYFIVANSIIDKHFKMLDIKNINNYYQELKEHRELDNRFAKLLLLIDNRLNERE